jgi:hypothetical protein
MLRLATDRGWSVMEKQRTYFMRRAAQERSAADHASGIAARSVHLELERRYRERVGISIAGGSAAAAE